MAAGREGLKGLGEVQRDFREKGPLVWGLGAFTNKVPGFIGRVE